jgi:glucosyl-3-phosphoglycerate phosphatase
MQKFHNTYFVMRHGRSKANEQEIILSNPEDGTTAYGLTEIGEQQAKASATDAKGKKILDNETIILSSDFTRTKETAEIVREVLNAKPITLTPKLRERYFGLWDKKHVSHYTDVWNNDKFDANHTKDDVESTADVRARTMSLITDLEKEYQGKTILLVSHGDALQILLTEFADIDSSQHRSLQHLETAEIRRVI